MDQENQLPPPGLTELENILSEGLELYDSPPTLSKQKERGPELSHALTQYRIRKSESRWFMLKIGCTSPIKFFKKKINFYYIYIFHSYPFSKSHIHYFLGTSETSLASLRTMSRPGNCPCHAIPVLICIHTCSKFHFADFFNHITMWSYTFVVDSNQSNRRTSYDWINWINQRSFHCNRSHMLWFSMRGLLSKYCNGMDIVRFTDCFLNVLVLINPVSCSTSCTFLHFFSINILLLIISDHWLQRYIGRSYTTLTPCLFWKWSGRWKVVQVVNATKPVLFIFLSSHFVKH